MINVRIKHKDDLTKWYIGAVLPIVMELNVNGSYTDTFDLSIVNALNNNTFCSDVLIMDINELSVKYEWIGQYKGLVDFCAGITELEKELNKISGVGSRNSRSNLLRFYYDKNTNTLINNILACHLPAIGNNDLRISEVTRYIKNFSCFVSDCKNRIDSLNRIILKRFNYNKILGNSDIRAQLVQKLDIKVCPYCNRQFINPITIGHNSKYLGDIDHILPKSKYALFQLSLFNLIPVCKVCNQLFKKDKTNVLNPYKEGFGEDVYLYLRYKSVKELIGIDKPSNYSWQVDLKDDDRVTRIRNNIDFFKLNEVYETNETEFQRVLRLKYIYESQAYRKSVLDILNKGKGVSVQLFDECLLYGVSLDEEKFQDEILSKAIYDLVIMN